MRVEHEVADYELWKREGFDRDPLGRERGGVRRSRILRASDTPGLVAIELEFDDRAAATAFADEREMWGRVGDRFGWREAPQARIFDLVAVS